MMRKSREAHLTRMVLERCDELEESAVRMAREIAHLRSMLELTLQEDDTTGMDADPVAELLTESLSQ